MNRTRMHIIGLIIILIAMLGSLIFNHNKQNGFSLITLVIGIVIGFGIILKGNEHQKIKK